MTTRRGRKQSLKPQLTAKFFVSRNYIQVLHFQQHQGKAAMKGGFTSNNVHFLINTYLQRGVGFGVGFFGVGVCFCLLAFFCCGLFWFFLNTLGNMVMQQNSGYQRALSSNQANILHPLCRMGLDATTRHHGEAEPWLSEVTTQLGRETTLHSSLLLLITQKIPEVPN